MKVPQSDMPEEALWQSFFNPESLLETLLPKVPVHGDAVELGAGYGTFTRAALNFVKGTLHAYEIETELCNDLKELVSESYPERLQVHCRDVLANGTGLSANSVELVMIFNLLHFGCPSVLLKHAYDILTPGGQLLIIHWRSDIATPRGPELQIRPSPNDVLKWCHQAQFKTVNQIDITDSCPWHFSVVAIKS